jgi:hypothetical protein
MPPTTIVIGTGISAIAYLRSFERDLGTVTALGGPDLWNQMDPHHQMGQPMPLLTGNLLGRGRAVRGFATVTGGSFLRAGVFAEAMRFYLARETQIRLSDRMVTEIRAREGGGYRVSGRYREDPFVLEVDNVIIALGTGPNRALTAGEDGKLEVDVAGMGGYVTGGTEFLSPDWRMPQDLDPRGRHVAIYGGSATAAWAVEAAEMRGMSVVLWFTRPDERSGSWDAAGRFAAAFPAGGRNTHVEEAFADRRAVLRLTKVKFFQKAQFIGLTFRNEAGDVILQAVDLLVYSLGAEHSARAGVRRMLHGTLAQQLVAFYDRSQAISSRAALLAVGTADRSLMIVGSAMSSAAGFRGDDLRVQGDPLRTLGSLGRYADIADSLPPAARPTEGIAMVMASIEALNEYMPARVAEGSREAVYTVPQVGHDYYYNPEGGQQRRHAIDFEWDINFNTSNRTQLAVYLAQTTDLDPFTANLTVALIVHLRTRNAFGLSDLQVQSIQDVAEAYVRLRRELDDTFEGYRYLGDRMLGADRVITLCVEGMTTSGDWVAFWQRYGIRC